MSFERICDKYQTEELLQSCLTLDEIDYYQPEWIAKSASGEILYKNPCKVCGETRICGTCKECSFCGGTGDYKTGCGKCVLKYRL